MKISFIRSLAICFVFILSPIKALADSERIALVIGNAAYPGEAALKNTINDARLIADTLSEIGFDVDLIENLTKADGPGAIEDFGEKAKGAEIAIIYYAGHGMELSGENYLIPIDADVRSEEATIRDAIALEDLQKAVSGASKAGLILFDACRTNPWVSEENQGLTGVIPTGNNILISFSAQPGSVAYDGGGGQGPYAEALSEALRIEPAYEISGIFRMVSQRVEATTKNKQDPLIVDNVSYPAVYLKPRSLSTVPFEARQGTDAGGVVGSAGGSEGELADATPLRSAKEANTVGITECDRQAGYTWRPRVGGGVRHWDDIDAEAALLACLQAIADHPEEPFFFLLAARAYFKADQNDPRILKYVRRSAQADEGFKLDRLANIAINGASGAEKNRFLAFHLASLAAQNGHPRTLIDIGDQFRDQEPKDPDRAMTLYRKAQEAGLPEASAKIAWGMMQDTAVERDFTVIRALYETAAAADIAWAINNLGTMDKQGQGAERNLDRALLRFEKACNMDHYLGCRNAGDILINPPFRMTQNFLRAEVLYTKACENGNALGCFGIGWLNDKNHLPNASIELAETYYRQACSNNVAGACNNLAIILPTEGRGDDVLIEASALQKKACELGDGIACGNLGQKLREYGLIIRPKTAANDINEEAFAAFEKGCDLNYARACNTLGNAFWNVEIGRTKDYEKAASYYLLACDGGNNWGCSNRARLARYGYIEIAEDPLEILHDLCKRDDAAGCRYFGQFTANDASDITPIDRTALRNAHAAIEKACALSDAKSCRDIVFQSYDFDPEWHAFPQGEYFVRFLENSDNVEALVRDFAVYNINDEQMDLEEVMSGLTTTFAQEIQRALKQRGLYDGDIDGIIGPQTRLAAEQLIGN